MLFGIDNHNLLNPIVHFLFVWFVRYMCIVLILIHIENSKSESTIDVYVWFICLLQCIVLILIHTENSESESAVDDSADQEVRKAQVSVNMFIVGEPTEAIEMREQ